MSIAEKQKTISSNNTAISEKNVSIATNTQKIYTSGYGKGYSLGNKDGRDEGYNIGRAAGYDDGYKVGEDNAIAEMWEGIQNGGKRTYYACAFRNQYFTKKTFKPKYDIVPVGVCNLVFYYIEADEPFDFVEIEQECGIKIDTSKATNLESFAQVTDAILRFNVIDLSSANNTYGMLWNCNNLKRVEKVISSEKTSYLAHAFRAPNLEHCLFEGIIAQNGFSVQYCTKLDKESLLSILDCLKDYAYDTSGTVWKVTLGSTNLDKLSAEEKAIATNKGWVLE